MYRCHIRSSPFICLALRTQRYTGQLYTDHEWQNPCWWVLPSLVGVLLLLDLQKIFMISCQKIILSNNEPQSGKRHLLYKVMSCFSIHFLREQYLFVVLAVVTLSVWFIWWVLSAWHFSLFPQTFRALLFCCSYFYACLFIFSNWPPRNFCHISVFLLQWTLQSC